MLTFPETHVKRYKQNNLRINPVPSMFASKKKIPDTILHYEKVKYPLYDHSSWCLDVSLATFKSIDLYDSKSTTNTRIE